ncbi:signal transduction histidine kinase [Streptomyces sp. V4I23]|uniref:hypothetical protein n=1 Tax=Streptomyces sp. V4I23 TaxID=3042282 RepID=UPI002788DCFF|nr:hypothetical protein [Streptomyces sp. V4I23]MDQ1013312.1 signal transduction histidine kinase [Streptomyces sp. V4I23]
MSTAPMARPSPLHQRDEPSGPVTLRTLYRLVTVVVALAMTAHVVASTALMLRQAGALRGGSVRDEEAGRLLQYEAYALAGSGALVTIVVTAVVATVGRAVIRRADRARITAVTVAQQHLPELVVRLQQGLPIDTGSLPEATGRRDEFGAISDAVARLARYALDSAYAVHRERDGFNRFCAGVAGQALVAVAALLRELDQLHQRSDQDAGTRGALYALDHEIVRLRRQLENLLLLAGGAVPHPHTRPVTAGNIVIDAVGESPGLQRVQTEFGAEGWIVPEAAGAPTHLLAELIDNALAYSAPQLSVVVRSVRTAGGIAFEVEDRGNGLSDSLLTELNGRLRIAPLFAEIADSDQLGLFVVGCLSAQLNIGVTLRPSAYGGLSAVVMVPASLLTHVPQPVAEHAPHSTSEHGSSNLAEDATQHGGQFALTAASNAAHSGEPELKRPFHQRAGSDTCASPGPLLAGQEAPAVTTSGLPWRKPGTRASPPNSRGDTANASSSARAADTPAHATVTPTQPSPAQPTAPTLTPDGLPRRTRGAHVAAQLRQIAGAARPGAPDRTWGPPPHPVALDDVDERTPDQIAAQFAGFPIYADPDEETSP